MSVVQPVVRRIGRFDLGRQLGRGAQATVWLAHDTRLDRDVAVKLLDPGAGSDAVHEWLNEAHAVSRLTHPNIVPVFEADEHAGQPYLVFEYVEGPTLAEARRGRGAWPAREAAETVLGVLDALAAAHAQGIVHRDLKPSNILLGRDGRARVMDFGIAARVNGGGKQAFDGRIVGTPGYISPEAARGERAAPAMDVFAAGVLLGELLAGSPLMVERDPYRALERVQTEDLLLPAQAQVDDVLRGIVQRALSRDPARRYDSARAMHSALAAWLKPADSTDAAGGHGTLDFLLRRMRTKSDFPALSDSVVRIQRVATSDTESLASLSAEILKDVALTNKLLRMVNTAQFRHAGGGSISTISRAVALVGFAGIRNMALSLVLLEHMKDKSQAALLKEEFLRALMAGTLASELTPAARDGEEAFIGSMFQNLGRLLVEYYFPDEGQQIREQLVRGPDTPAARDQAAQRVLGIGLQDLGVGIARSWGLPDSLQRAMRVPEGAIPSRPLGRGVDRTRWLGRGVNEMTDLMLSCEGDELADRLSGLAEAYAGPLGIAPREIVGAAQGARGKLAQLAQAMGLQVGAASPSRRLLGAQAPSISDSLSPHQLQPTVVENPPDAATLVLPREGAPDTAKVADMLAAGIQDITNSMVAENFRLNEVLRMVLETMYRALDFRHVVFCLRDPKTETLTGRFGLGANVDAMTKAFRVPLRVNGAPDLFAAVCLKGADTLIADTRAGNIAARLPTWYREAVDAPSFLLLPMQAKKAPFALIYADKAQPGALELGEKELSLLRTLRNQAVMAFRQAG
jgi:serine/threonine protein kinase